MASRNEIQALNLAYFGRPSDPTGLAGTVSSGLSATEIARAYASTGEYQYNTFQPNTQGQATNYNGLINTYYQRLFARDAVQLEVNAWVDAINSGVVEVDLLGLKIVEAGVNAGGSLLDTLSNKIGQANSFSESLSETPSLSQKYASWLAVDIGMEFNSKIEENTTSGEAQIYRAEAFARLPEPGVLIEVSENSTTVAEGNSVGVVVEGFGPDLAGETLEYAIVGQNGFGAGDLVDGSLVGSVTLDANGNGLIQVSIKADGVDLGESFTVKVSSTLGGSVSTDVITVTDAPAPVPILSVSPSSQSVDEGEDLTFAITSSDLAPGTSLSWIISGVDSADLSGAATTGTVALDSIGLAFVTFAVAEDLTFEGSETANFLVVASPTVTANTSVVINDTSIPPTSSLLVQVQPVAVNEGQFLTFSITSENLAGSSVAWNAGTLSPQDVVGGIVAGTVVLNAEGEATVVLVTSEDASVNEGDETFAFTVTSGGLTSSVSATIFDSSVAPVQAVLTENTDIVENALVTGFTIIGNEETLGQNDQISSAPSGATLNIGTENTFEIGNFSTDNIETFLFNPSASRGERGEIDMRNAVGVENLNVNRSNLTTFEFDDLQSAADLTANLDDSFTDFEFNFDASALTGDDSLDVVFSEAPIDAASGESLGIVATQGPTAAAASIETLNLTSTGVSDTNILGALSVGPDLEELNIDGTVDLDVLQDIGLPQDTDLRVADEAGNSDVSRIDARGLAADLFGGVSAYTTTTAPTGNGYFTYTSEVAGDVEVFGATGDNYLQLVSGQTRGGTTSFIVETQDGDDDILTDIGNDDVDAGEGDNTVFTFDGDDDVVTLEGNDLIDTGIGADFVSSGGGNDDIDAGDGFDFVQAGNGNNTVFAFGGDNTIFSLEGNDLIVTTDGGDFIDSGFGDDVVIAGPGGDTVVSLGGDNVINTTLFASGDITDDSSDSVVTGAGDDTINTGGGSDVVDSGAGNDFVVDGNVTGTTIGLDDDGNTFNLGLGDDELSLSLDNLQLNDVIDGGLGIDTVTLHQGGVLRQSETLQTTNVEALNLVEGGNFDVTLSEDLIETSDDIRGIQRVFSVYTGSTPGVSSLDDTAGDVTLDLTNLAPISEGLANVPLINSVRYSGQDDGSTERVIVTDRMMSSFTHLRFGEIGGETSQDPDSDVNLDILVVQDEIELSNSDLSNVDGLEVIDLTSTLNDGVTFTLDFSSMTESDFQRLVGDLYPNEGNTTNDELLIRATESLNVASASLLELILPIDDAAAVYIGDRITIEETAQLNYVISNEIVGHEVAISTALFFTPNADDLSPTAGQTVVAYELSDLQTADRVEGDADVAPAIVGGGPLYESAEKIDFRFGLANDLRTMQEQLNNIFTDDVDVFDFDPGAVNQAVRFEGLFEDNLGSGEVQTIFGLDSIFTSGGDDRMVEIEAIQFADTDDVPDPTLVVSTQLFVDSAEGDDTVTTEDSVITPAFDARITVTAGSGNDSVVGFNGFNSDDLLFGQAGDDTIFGRNGEDAIFGDFDGFTLNDDGDDSLNGGDGNDSIFGGNGDNTVDGQNDDDFITTGNGADSIRGGENEDTIISGAGSDTVFGDNGFDSIFGNDGVDLIEGGNDGDVIDGGADADVIYGDRRFGGGFDGDDTISGGTGDDLIFTGLGEDIASGNEDDDTIVFGNGLILEEFTNDDITTPTGFQLYAFPVENGNTGSGTADGFFTERDTVNGGDGDDVLSFAMGTVEPDLTLKDREALISGAEVRGIETINVMVNNQPDSVIATAAAVLTIDNSILKDVEAVDGVKTIQVNVAGQDQTPGIFPFSPAGALNFDARSFVQGEAVVFYDSDLVSSSVNTAYVLDPDSINRRQFGSGDDTYANNNVLDVDPGSVTPSNWVYIEGNGGADTIYLSTEPGTREYVKYNTGNDGGVGGASTGGDTVFNFSTFESGAAGLDRDYVVIGSDGELPLPTGTNATGLLFDLTQRQGSFPNYAFLYGSVNEQLTLGGQTQGQGPLGDTAIDAAAGGDNFLFLTGPARSLQDDELTDASAIAQAINNVGVVSNGLSFGSPFGNPTLGDTIRQQSNQALIVQQGQFDSAVWLYIEDDLDFNVGEAHTAEASELRQLGIFNNALLTFEDFQTDAGGPVTIL